ncbi:MAG TPA: hypothetical protein VK943_00560, partial [Arenibaculum sp.]|nr:hypothetical protein [Arenibaculum sp.]
MRADRRGQRGIALVAVLWVLVALAMMAAGTLRTGRLETGLARNTADNARAAALAEAGIYRAVAGLLEPAPEFAWQPDGIFRSFPFAGGTVRVRIEAEGGKVDLNEAPQDLLAAVMEAGGAPPDAARALAGAIADFRDPDQLVRPGGPGGGGGGI